MCSNTLFTYPFTKDGRLLHRTGVTAQTQLTSTRCVNTCSGAWLAPADRPVYTRARGKLGPGNSLHADGFTPLQDWESFAAAFWQPRWD